MAADSKQASKRRERPVSVGRRRYALLLAAPAIGLALSGCGSGDSVREATAVVSEFQAAVRAQDGASACALLAAPTRAALVDEEGAGCARAILRKQLSEQPAAREDAYVTAAFVELADRSAYFLQRRDEGWRISGGACEPTLPGRPYACELEG